MLGVGSVRGDVLSEDSLRFRQWTQCHLCSSAETTAGTSNTAGAYLLLIGPERPSSYHPERGL